MLRPFFQQFKENKSTKFLELSSATAYFEIAFTMNHWSDLYKFVMKYVYKVIIDINDTTGIINQT